MLKRLRQEERGAVMVLAAATLTLLLLFTGMALDFGRVHLLRAQLQTAVDASSLAGALQVVPMATISRDRKHGEYVDEYDAKGKLIGTHLEWHEVSPATATGTQWDLINQGGWVSETLSQCNPWPNYACSSSYTITKEWLVMPESATDVAERTFWRNAVWPASATVEDLEVTIKPDPKKPEVTATARMSTPTSFLKLIGMHELRFTRTATARPVKN